MAFARPHTRSSFHAAGLGLRETVREEAQRRRNEARGAGRTMRDWALLVPERGLPLDLEQFPYQREWYSEEVASAREVRFMKSTQVGLSAWAWRWAARRAEQFGDHVIYFFPTDDDVSDFGDQRIEPSIEGSDFLRKRIPSYYVRHKHLKQIAGGWLALRGIKSKTSVQSVDADALVFDEYDLLDRTNLAQAERRLSGAEAAGRVSRTLRLGNPSLPGYGIHSLYERSDRRVWHVTCPECGDEQPLEFAANVRWVNPGNDDVMRAGRDEYEDREAVEHAWRACRSCEASLEPSSGDLGPIHAGRWVRTADSDVVGYHVSRLIVPRTDLRKLVENSRKTAPHEVEAFHNHDLGLPYSPAEASLTEDDVNAAASRGRMPVARYTGRNTVLMGLDVASERDLTVVVDELLPSGDRRTLHAGEPRSFEEVVVLMERFGVHVCVVDSLPERRQARALARAFPGRVFLASYDYRNEADAFSYNAKKNLVTINRTEAIDAMMDAIRQQRKWPLRVPPPRYVAQVTAPKRRTEIDGKGKPLRAYVSTGGEGDDYAHAETYAMVAGEMWRQLKMMRREMRRADGQRVPDETLGFRRPSLADEADVVGAGR